MFFEDIFDEFLNNEDLWLPIIGAVEEERAERDFDDMSDDEIRSHYELE